MDRHVTVRFYEIADAGVGGRSAETILRRVAQEASHVRRQKDVAEGCRIRLEALTEDDDLMIGDIARVQNENLPSHITDDGTEDLPVERIGHHVAFCYDPETSIIAFQYDVRAVSIGRFCTYLSEFGGSKSLFGHVPVLRDDAWKAFQNQTPRKLTLRIARVENFAHVTDRTTPFEDQIVDMSERYDAPSIEITISAKRGGKLKKPEVLAAIGRWVGFQDQIEGVRKIEAETIESDDAFNFLKHLLREYGTIKIDGVQTVAERRELTMNLVRGCYERHRPELRRQYAAPDNS